MFLRTSFEVLDDIMPKASLLFNFLNYMIQQTEKLIASNSPTFLPKLVTPNWIFTDIFGFHQTVSSPQKQGLFSYSSLYLHCLAE